MKHDDSPGGCGHCQALRKKGECCQLIYCVCRIAFHEDKLQAVRAEMLANYQLLLRARKVKR